MHAGPNRTTCNASLLSLAETEIDEENNHKKIKVRDYAYPTSFPRSTPAPCLSPVTEIFNQYEGIAEVEYCWTQAPRMYPVPGKILSRLLDMGWITEDDIRNHASPMDLAELRKHNARVPYPWKPLRWTTIPKNEERKELMLARASFFQQRDAARMAHFQGSEMARKDKSRTNSKKRKGFLAPPPFKQYPAPLHCYDPNFYPEATFPNESPASSNPPSHRHLMRQSTCMWTDNDKTEKENNN